MTGCVLAGSSLLASPLPVLSPLFGKFFQPILYRLINVITPLCILNYSEWFNDVGNDATCKDSSDNGAVKNWMVPLSTTLLIFCWALSFYLFSIGSKTIEKEHQLLSNAY